MLVNAPYGPSTNTRLPGWRPRSPALVVPTAFAVSRRCLPSGAAESENGLACHQPLWSGKRQMQNWPARAGSLSRSRPVTYTEVAFGPSGTTPATRNACRALRRSGITTRPTTNAPITSAHTVHQ